MKKIIINEEDKHIKRAKKICCILLLAMMFSFIHIASPILANFIKEMNIEILTNYCFALISILSIWFIFFTGEEER